MANGRDDHVGRREQEGERNDYATPQLSKVGIVVRAQGLEDDGERRLTAVFIEAGDCSDYRATEAEKVNECESTDEHELQNVVHVRPIHWNQPGIVDDVLYHFLA